MPQTSSPLRYPGGKSQLYPFVEHLISTNKLSGTYVEPFAGGAGIALKLLINNRVDNIWINDFDNAIYSIWFYILNEPEQLINLIESVPFDYSHGHFHNKEESISFWKKEKQTYMEQKDKKSSLQLAFAALFLNRTNRSGIISSGPIGGFEQDNKTQIYARFNKATLIHKIHKLSNLKDRIKLTNLDATDLIDQIPLKVPKDKSFIFFDPPYFKQGGNLYFTSYNERGHRELSQKIQALHDFYWITTYDIDKHIQEFFGNCHKSFTYHLHYSANNKRRGVASEFLFASDLLNIDSYEKVQLTPLNE